MAVFPAARRRGAGGRGGRSSRCVRSVWAKPQLKLQIIAPHPEVWPPSGQAIASRCALRVYYLHSECNAALGAGVAPPTARSGTQRKALFSVIGLSGTTACDLPIGTGMAAEEATSSLFHAPNTLGCRGKSRFVVSGGLFAASGSKLAQRLLTPLRFHHLMQTPASRMRSAEMALTYVQQQPGGWATALRSGARRTCT